MGRPARSPGASNNDRPIERSYRPKKRKGDKLRGAKQGVVRGGL